MTTTISNRGAQGCTSCRRATLDLRRPSIGDVTARVAARVEERRGPSRPLLHVRASVRGPEAEPGTPNHEVGRNVARFLYWSATVAGFMVSGIPAVALYGATVPLSMYLNRSDGQVPDKSAERHETLTRVAGVAQIGAFVVSVL